jgi:opacity protein-like surface antigen
MRIHFAALAACALFAVVPDTAGAQVPEYRFSVTPFVGYQMGGQFEDDDGGNEVDLNDASSFGLILNAPADDHTEWEIFYSRQSAGLHSATVDIPSDLDLEVTHVLVGGTYVFDRELFRPFISAGIGAAHLAPDGEGFGSDTVFAFGIGGGAQFFPESRIGLRVEGRALGSVIDSDTSIFCVSNGGATCSFRASGEILWQFEVFGGLVARF